MIIIKEITVEDVVKNWGSCGLFGEHPHYLSYLVDILNKKYPLDVAIEDILSFPKEDEG